MRYQDVSSVVALAFLTLHAVPARGDVVSGGLLRDDTFLLIGGRTYSDFGFTNYPGEFEVETARFDHSFARASGYALPIGEGAVFGVTSDHKTTYSLSRCESRSTVAAPFAVSEETTYELAGSLLSLPDTTSGTISLVVELQRWQNNVLMEVLFHQDGWIVAEGGSRLDLGIAQGGDIDGSLTGTLLPDQDYRLEATYRTECPTSSEMYAHGQIDLVIGNIPAPGPLATMGVLTFGLAARRKR